ncbi:MAG: hypothetical protein VX185_16675 [Pseudomonadota bacterium]|nr:hypothetical protein [Pseudomonadota bacterium]
MNQSLEQIITQQGMRPLEAEQVFLEYNDLWQSLHFDQTQVALWLASLPIKDHQTERSAGFNVATDLEQHLVALLEKAGGRMPLAQVLRQLPTNMVTSEQHIRKLAQQNARLDIKGPLLVLV